MFLNAMAIRRRLRKKWIFGCNFWNLGCTLVTTLLILFYGNFEPIFFLINWKSWVGSPFAMFEPMLVRAKWVRWGRLGWKMGKISENMRFFAKTEFFDPEKWASWFFNYFSRVLQTIWSVKLFYRKFWFLRKKTP